MDKNFSPMKNRIIQILNVSSFDYENYQHSCFELWVSKYSYVINIPVRKLTVSDKIYSWYLWQWEIYVESHFFTDNIDFIESDMANNSGALFKVFDLYPDEILKFYPKVLFKKFTDASIKENTKS